MLCRYTAYPALKIPLGLMPGMLDAWVPPRTLCSDLAHDFLYLKETKPRITQNPKVKLSWR